MAIPSEFLTAAFVLVCHGDGAFAAIVHGWDALCAAWIDAHVHEPDEQMSAEVLAPLLDLGNWTTDDFDGLPYHYLARYEDGAVEVIRITDGVTGSIPVAPTIGFNGLAPIRMFPPVQMNHPFVPHIRPFVMHNVR